MRTLDCTDIKVLLSGLIDDQVDTDSRYAAERHLAECRSCRDLVNEAEALDELLLTDGAAPGPGDLPDGFEGEVLARTVHGRLERPYLQRWTTWTGWMAAAACLALALVVWTADRRNVFPGSSGTDPEPMPIAYSTGTELRSTVLQVPVDSDDDHRGGTDRQGAGRGLDFDALAALSREDVETLHAASVLLHLLEDADPETIDDLRMIRRVVEYDELGPRLASVRSRLTSHDRAAVLATEQLLGSVTIGSIEHQSVPALQEMADQLELTETLDALSRRWDPGSSL